MPRRPPARRAPTPQGRGRYPGFDVLSQVRHWDEVTAGAVLSRLSHPTGLAFFSPAEVAVARPLLDLLLAQDSDPRVPVLEEIDRRLAVAETDGWHHDEMPEDAQAWRQSLVFLDDDARERFCRPFPDLDAGAQAALLLAVQRADDRWHGWPAEQVWSLWTRYACTAFYSHPWAWNEIGFPGPAYPRGYLNLGLGARDKQERHDAAPADPVLFAERVERAHGEHAALTGEDR